MSNMKISNKLVIIVLSLSIILNIIFALYVYKRIDPGASAPVLRIAKILGKNKQHSSILHYESNSAGKKITRTMILNTLVEKYNYQSFLEIGQGQRFANFDWINCGIKIGVDPDKTLSAAYQTTSDEFFSKNKDSFDLIFIDGLHEADQVEKDITNALNVLNDNGTIVVHDCNPKTKEMQVVPRQVKYWSGDVWKAWVRLRSKRPNLKMFVIDADRGLGIIRKGTQEIVIIPEPLTYEELDKNRKVFLNLVDINFFLKDLR